MSIDVNEVAAQERALQRAREAAALKEYSGMVKLVHIVRILGWLCALVPIIGIFGIGFLGGLIPFVGFVYLGFQGAVRYAVKQILITVGGVVGAMLLWLVVNVVVVSAFG